MQGMLEWWKQCSSIGTTQTLIQHLSDQGTQVVGKCARVLIPNLRKYGRIFLDNSCTLSLETSLYQSPRAWRPI